MTDPMQQVRAMARTSDAVWLDKDLWRAVLRAHALPATGPRAPKMIKVDGVLVRPHELITREDKVT